MKYLSLSPNAEISGRSVLITYNTQFPFSNPSVQDLMLKEGLSEINELFWYSQQKSLNVIEELENVHGTDALELMGYQMISDVHALAVTDLEADLLFIDTVYRLAHRNDDNVYYDLIEYTPEKCRAVFECITAYPFAFDKGIMKAIVERQIGKGKKIELFVDDTMREGPDDKRRFVVITWEP
jgi:hypothetical protein